MGAKHLKGQASMDESEAVDEQGAVATPIFSVYRRGYDPEQVDRYVADQQRRLDDAIHRSSEAERKLAAAVGQLRELHRRVAVYESEARNSQPPQLDTLGERVQRILQEAWEGAYNLRQEAERDVTELREQAQAEVDGLRTQVQTEVESLRAQTQTDVEALREVASREAADVVDEATRRALHIRDETERRRQAYLERVERDREQAIAQITYLYDQRQGAIAELARLQATVQSTVEEMVRSPLGRPAPGVMAAAADSAVARAASSRAHPAGPARGMPSPGPSEVTLPEPAIEPPSPPAPRAARSPEAHQLPGVLDDVSPSADETRLDPLAHLDVPTGPMERFVRPTDREEARAVARHSPSAEADAMERAMRHGVPAVEAPTAAPGATGRSTAPGGPAAALRPPGRPRPEGAPEQTEPPAEAAEEERPASRQSSRPALGGRMRARRQPQQGVYDVEQDSWS
jgi:acyl-coenzyme A thioesterase PaaI-like protein